MHSFQPNMNSKKERCNALVVFLVGPVPNKWPFHVAFHEEGFLSFHGASTFFHGAFIAGAVYALYALSACIYMRFLRWRFLNLKLTHSDCCLLFVVACLHEYCCLPSPPRRLRLSPRTKQCSAHLRASVPIKAKMSTNTNIWNHPPFSSYPY